MEVANTVTALQEKKTIVYPTDTVWGIGCDATDEVAVAKVFELKKRAESKSLIVLVNSIAMLTDYLETVPEKALEVLEKATKPTTIIYNTPKGFARNTIAQDNTIAIRIVSEGFCNELIAKFGKPIVSTSANISGTPTPKSFAEINKAILDNVDYVVNLHHEKISEKSSTILRIDADNEIQVIRA